MEPSSPATGLNVVGIKPAGVTKKVVAEIVRNVRKQMLEKGHSVVVRSLLFIPSTRTASGEDEFEILVNTLVEAKQSVPPRRRRAALETIATVAGRGRVQRLERLAIPFIEQVTL